MDERKPRPRRAKNRAAQPKQDLAAPYSTRTEVLSERQVLPIRSAQLSHDAKSERRPRQEHVFPTAQNTEKVGAVQACPYTCTLRDMHAPLPAEPSTTWTGKGATVRQSDRYTIGGGPSQIVRMGVSRMLQHDRLRPTGSQSAQSRSC